MNLPARSSFVRCQLLALTGLFLFAAHFIEAQAPPTDEPRVYTKNELVARFTKILDEVLTKDHHPVAPVRNDGLDEPHATGTNEPKLEGKAKADPAKVAAKDAAGAAASQERYQSFYVSPKARHELNGMIERAAETIVAAKAFDRLKEADRNLYKLLYAVVRRSEERKGCPPPLHCKPKLVVNITSNKIDDLVDAPPLPGPGPGFSLCPLFPFC